MDLRSSSITADILNFISDGKQHTYQEIADEVEVSYMTVRRHIASLSYRYPIEISCGHKERGGGVRLDKTSVHQGKILTRDELQIISKALRLLQESGCKDVNQDLLMKLISEYSAPNKEQEETDSYAI